MESTLQSQSAIERVIQLCELPGLHAHSIHWFQHRRSSKACLIFGYIIFICILNEAYPESTISHACELCSKDAKEIRTVNEGEKWSSCKFWWAIDGICISRLHLSKFDEVHLMSASNPLWAQTFESFYRFSYLGSLPEMISLIKSSTSFVSPKLLHSLACSRLLRNLAHEQIPSRVLSPKKA